MPTSVHPTIYANPESSESSRPVSSTQRVADELRKRIVTCAIEPGEKLKVESLKAMLDVGASPIREALSLLTSDQLVERIDQRGFRAAPADKTQFQEILTLRCQLEEIALRNSVSQGGVEWEEHLVLSHHRLQQAKRSKPEDWELAHRNFHEALLQACGSPILLRFCAQLYDLNIRYRFLAGRSERYEERDIEKEHRDIMDAAIDRDADAACKTLLTHYRRTGEFLFERI